MPTYSREKVVEQAKEFLGLNVKDGSYRQLLDIWNSQKKPPRGIIMKEGMSWCAMFWSVVALQLGYQKVMPIEVSCGNLIELAKKMGIWVENDNYIPKPGDAILYDWDDSGKGDNTGWPDHIGVVEKVSSTKKTITVIEGNYQKSVKRRMISVGGRYIRGFICPKYDDAKQPDVPKKKPLLSYISASNRAKKVDKSISGTYTVSANLRLRDDATTNSKILTVIPKGSKVFAKGLKTGKWWIVEYEKSNILYKGFVYSTYLKKVNS